MLQAGSLVDPAKTIHQLMLAGNRDIEAAAFEEALLRFEQALELVPADPQTRADLDFGFGSALRSLGRWDEAIERWKRAIDAYVSLGEREAAGRASWYAAEQLSWIARWDEALVVAGEGLNALGDIRNGARVGLTSNVAVMFSAGGYMEAADQMFAEAEALAGELREPALLGQVLSLKTVHLYFCGLPRAAVDTGLRSAELLRAAGDSWNLANALAFVALTAAFMLDFDQANAAAAEATELAERLGHLPARWLAHRSTWLEAQTGDLDVFERFGERDVELIRGLPWISGTAIFQSEVAFRRGRWDETVRLLEEAIDQEVAEAIRAGDVGMLVLALAYAGDRVRAMRLYEEEAPGLTGVGDAAPLGAAILMCAAVEALWMLGARDEAARHYAALIEYGPRTGTAVRTWDARLLDTLAGIAAAAGQDWETAERHFADAIERADRMPHLVEQADARRFYAQMLAERNGPNDRERARELLADVIGRYGRLGMPMHEVLTESLRSKLG
jgi:tetratricopeptide (TPR) repeat protein